GREERSSAADAMIHASALLAIVGMREGALSAVLASYVELFGSKLLAPLGFGFDDRGFGPGGCLLLHLQTPCLLFSRPFGTARGTSAQTTHMHPATGYTYAPDGGTQQLAPLSSSLFSPGACTRCINGR